MSGYPGLWLVDSTFGAPMGRHSVIDSGERKLHLRRLRFVDGGYDAGGAYWGSPANVWHAVNACRGIEVFVRADTREEAKRKVSILVKGARFYR